MGYVDYRRRLAFVTALRRACQHEWANARIYRALATRASDAPRRIVLLRLADTADRRAARHQALLRRLGTGRPPDVDTWGDRVWRWLLVRLGTRCALAWTGWVECNDIGRLACLAEWAANHPKSHKCAAC